jgi:ABC-type transport system involved in cytochrome bd biosynthesis fused ATPase/permease subunit
MQSLQHFLSFIFGRLKYSVTGYIVSNNRSVESNCNTLQFINQGTSTVTINELNLQLAPGENFTLYGNVGEQCTTFYNVSFSTVFGEKNQLVVLVKQYVNG